MVFALTSCSTSRKVTTQELKVPAKFEYIVPSQAPIGSSQMTIALVKPVFINEYAEYLSSPFPEMAISMGNDFEELLTSKGFTIRGPYNSRDEMIYSDKVNSSFVLEIQIDLQPNYQCIITPKTQNNWASLLSSSIPSTSTYYSASGTITFGGNLIITALSPQYGEKIWKKNIALENIVFDFKGTELYYSRPSMADQLREDNAVYNIVTRNLEKFYTYSLDLVWKQIDPEEMKIVAKQSKEADNK